MFALLLCSFPDGWTLLELIKTQFKVTKKKGTKEISNKLHFRAFKKSKVSDVL